MTKIGGIVTFLYFLAFAAGVVSLFLPFWVTTEVDTDTREVTIVKTTRIGLWWSRDTFEIKDSSLTEQERDDSWNNIEGTSKNSDGVKAVKGMIILGLGVLLLVIIIAGCTRCCANDSNEYRMQSIFCGSGVAAIIAGILIAIGPIVYYTEVKGDYKFDGNDLDWCFWTAVASACAATTAGILGILGCLVSFRFAKRKSLSD